MRIVSLNSHLKEKSISIIINVVNLVILANVATAARNEMIGVFLSANDEEGKEVASPKSEALMDQFQEILLHNNILYV